MRARWGTRGGQWREAPSEGEQTSGREGGSRGGKRGRERESAARRLREAPGDKAGGQELLGGAGREEEPGERARGWRGERVCALCARAGGRRGSQRRPGSRRLGPSGGRADSMLSLLIWILTLFNTFSQGKPQLLARESRERARSFPENTEEFLVKRPNLLPLAARENRELRSLEPRSE